MANAEHLAILQQGVEVWNKWRDSNIEVKPDLREENLSGTNLSGANLSEINLRRVKLKGTNLFGANLFGANLSGADLSYAYMSGANLFGANLSGADLRKADLSGANLTGADLREASLQAANLNVIALSGANLRGADLSYADLSYADLSEAILSGASLREAVCILTLFTGVDLSEVNGLDEVEHKGRSYIDVHTLYLSKGKIPEIFLRGCGIPDDFITFIPSLTGKAIEFYSCFISYSHSDKDFARRLFDTLQGRGIRCWLDEKQIKPGHDLAAEIDRGIKYWDKTILCCSKSAMTEKWWVAFEMKKALAKEQDLMRERGQSVRAIIPLDLDGYLLGDYAGEYRSEIMSRSVANFKGHESDITIFDSEVERVIAALRTDEGRESPPPSRL